MSYVGENFRRLMRSRLAKNILSMYFVQGARYLIPLVTIPYLARVLGASSWGELAFIQAFSLYLCMVVDYGFELSATREIAENRDNNEKLSRALVNVLAVKCALSLGVFLLAGLISKVFNHFHVSPLLYWMGVYWALANTFNLFWFFQGIEEVHNLAGLDVLAKLIGLIAIILFVKEPGDEWMVLATYGASSTAVFVIAFYMAVNRVGVTIPTINNAASMFRTGWDTFLIRLCSGIYASASPFFLGLFVTPELVGPYSAAEKVARTSKELMRPVTRTLYPRFSILVKTAPLQALAQIKRAALVLSILGAMLSGIIAGFAENIVSLIFGDGYSAAVPLLQLLSMTIVLSVISNVLAIQWLLPNGYDKQVKIISLISVLVFVILALFLVPVYSGFGMAWSIVFTEISMIVMSAIAVKRGRQLAVIF